MLSGCRVLIFFCLLPGSVIFFSSLICSVVTDSELCGLHLPGSFVGLIQAESIQLEATVGFKLGGEKIEYFFPLSSLLWGCASGCISLYMAPAA